MTAAWTFREGVNTEHVFHFLQCVADIVDTLNELNDADEDIAGLQAISSARRISIQLRKDLVAWIIPKNVLSLVFQRWG